MWSTRNAFQIKDHRRLVYTRVTSRRTFMTPSRVQQPAADSSVQTTTAERKASDMCCHQVCTSGRRIYYSMPGTHSAKYPEDTRAAGARKWGLGLFM